MRKQHSAAKAGVDNNGRVKARPATGVKLDLDTQGLFQLGQVVRHRLFGYLGVIIDVDPHYSPEEVNYMSPGYAGISAGEPWFKLLVHNTACEGYAPQGDLVPLQDSARILHPDLLCYFHSFANGLYRSNIAYN